MDYIVRAGANEAARRIKGADLEENSINPPRSLERRYRNALACLRAREGS